MEPTKAYLRGAGEDDALAALDYLAKCEAGGDFAEFSPKRVLEQARAFYRLAEPGAAPDRGDI